jgi:hypothetical protein
MRVAGGGVVAAGLGKEWFAAGAKSSERREPEGD